VDRIYEAVRVWLGCFSSLSEALHPGHVRVAVVDERGVNVAGEEAWIWLAVEPRSGRLLALRLS
jgi:transposase-like protein